jgi:hypothetical protein
MELTVIAIFLSVAGSGYFIYRALDAIRKEIAEGFQIVKIGCVGQLRENAAAEIRMLERLTTLIEQQSNSRREHSA